MGFKRFLAPTARMAMDAVRRELGGDAVILANRRLGNQVEILAAAPHAVEAIVEGEVAVAPSRFDTVREGAAMYASVATTPEEADEDVRPWTPPQWKGASVRFGNSNARPAARRALQGAAGEPSDALAAATPRDGAAPAASSAPIATTSARTAAPRGVAKPQTARGAEAGRPAPAVAGRADPAPRAPSTDAPPAVFRRRPSRLLYDVDEGPRAVDALPAEPAAAGELAAAAAAATPAATTHPTSTLADDPRVIAELQALRNAFNQQLAALGSSLATTLAAAARGPAAVPADRPAATAATVAPPSNTAAAAAPTNVATVHVLIRLLTCGFSAALARYIAQRAPQGVGLADVDAWLQQAIAANVKCADPTPELLDAGGAIALIGPTGVGKTTTLAKLAARFAVRHGAANLGLVTLDSYRVGAHEQLRTYGRILGAPVQIAHDAATLAEILVAMKGKKLVLIDTCGVSQRDDRVGETLAMLDAARFGDRAPRRLLLLNAALHVETLEDVARAWRAADAAGAILTKIDEAARCGAALDCVMRHQLRVLGLTNGQRVPEDWHAANAPMLAHVALKPIHERFGLEAAEANAIAAAAVRQRRDA